MSSSARTTRVCFFPRPKDLTRAFKVGFLSIDVVYVRPTPRIETASSLVMLELEADSELTLPRQEEICANEEDSCCPSKALKHA